MVKNELFVKKLLILRDVMLSKFVLSGMHLLYDLKAP